MEETLRRAGEIALHRICQQGVAGEAFLLHNRELSIDISAGEIETLKEAEQIGLGVRVFNSGRVGFAYSTDLSPAAIDDVVRNAVSISAYTAADEFNQLPEGKQEYPAMHTYDPGITATSLEEKIELARAAERAARAYDPRVDLVERAGYQEATSSILIMNSRGLNAGGKGNYCGLHVSLAAHEDEECQNGFAFSIHKKIAALDACQVGEEAAMKAVRSLKGRTIASTRIPCLMEPYVVTRFMNLLAISIQADAVQKGKSMLADKLGQQVAASNIKLVDDATYEDGLGSFPFDGEGIPSRKNTILEQGVLRGFLFDHHTALKAGQKSTGNAVRGSFRSLPGVGTTNLILGPGIASPEELIADTGSGFYITEVMGMHTANPISGDFSVGAAGIMIEQGRLAYPVRGVTIAGNLWQLLQDIDTVGSDLRFFGSRAAATVRLNSMSVGGH